MAGKHISSWVWVEKRFSSGIFMTKIKQKGLDFEALEHL